MVFSSLYFIFIFLPVVCFIYFLLKLCFPQKIFIRNLFLCLVSLFFYAWGEPVYIFLMLASILVNYLFALKHNKFLFVCSIVFNLFFLFFFKYLGFFVENINGIFNCSISVPNLKLPIGISFYTFQALSYVIDVYRNKIKPQKNILTVALYISFFPQLIAGPIVRYVDIEEKLSERKETFDGFIEGLKVFIVGLGAKVIIANNMAVVSDGIFGNLSEAGTGILWLAALSYAFQIYFDFYGYSKMAIGLGKMFGFDFPENFNYPYCASSITDFWRRWHITLSVWFRDYLYIPLGGNRVGFVRHIVNIMIVWLFTGFWHGASWNFVLWGLYYGILLIFEKYFVFRLINKAESKQILNTSLKVILRFATLFLILIGWVLFRNEDFNQLKLILQGLFIIDPQKSSILVYISEHADVCSKMIFIIPAIIFSVPVGRKISSLSQKYTFAYCIEIFLIFVIFAVSICLLVASTYNPFIYFRF